MNIEQGICQKGEETRKILRFTAILCIYLNFLYIFYVKQILFLVEGSDPTEMVGPDVTLGENHCIRKYILMFSDVFRCFQICAWFESAHLCNYL